MASIIPNRKPDTPVQQLITGGQYQPQIKINQFKTPSAFPGPASTIAERNKKPYEEITIKPITQTKIDSSFYNPKNHLSPFLVNEQKKDVSLNSLHSTRIFNRKQAALNEAKLPQAYQTNQVSKNEFQELKKYNSSGYMSATHQKTMSLAENRNYISQHENEYYKSNKIFFKPPTSYNNKYSFSTPEYMRVDEQKLTLIKTGANVFKPGETVTVVSRSNGWLTVDPNTMSRKNCLDKQLKGNLHKSSHMSPQWMQTNAQRDEQQMKSFQPLTTIRQNVRCEDNRVLLADKYEPPKSIFNLGQIRHNVHTKEEAMQQMGSRRNFSTQPVRLLEWNENPSKQFYDSTKVTGKIGQQ